MLQEYFASRIGTAFGIGLGFATVVNLRVLIFFDLEIIL